MKNIPHSTSIHEATLLTVNVSSAKNASVQNYYCTVLSVPYVFGEQAVHHEKHSHSSTFIQGANAVNNSCTQKTPKHYCTVLYHTIPYHEKHNITQLAQTVFGARTFTWPMYPVGRLDWTSALTAALVFSDSSSAAWYSVRYFLYTRSGNGSVLKSPCRCDTKKRYGIGSIGPSTPQPRANL